MDDPVIKLADDDVDVAMFWCEPCDSVHAIKVHGEFWEFNNDLVHPTFHPSVKVEPYPGWQVLCHSFIDKGNIRYLTDCEHDKAGQELKLLSILDWPL